MGIRYFSLFDYYKPHSSRCADVRGFNSRALRLIFSFVFCSSLLAGNHLHAQSTSVSEFPSDLQLYPRDFESNVASVEVAGTVTAPYTEVELNVFREGELWNRWNHQVTDSASFEFLVELPAELANYDFELIAVNGNNRESIAAANDVVAGDVYVINGQSNAASGIWSAAGPGNEDASNFVRSFGVMGLDEWINDTDWHVVVAECFPSRLEPGCIGRWGLRFGSNIVNTEQVPVAVINGARGGRDIAYFQRNDANSSDLTTNYGRLNTRLNLAGVAENIRGFMWYQGESDRVNVEGHINGFTELFSDWQNEYPSVEEYYLFQIRHTCVPLDLVYGQGVDISNFQREFANARGSVTAVSTTALDGHDGCHFAYLDGYQQLGDNISRIVRNDLYDRSFQNAEAADIVSAVLASSNTVDLTFTSGNSLTADDGFEALFELKDSNDGQSYAITDGSVIANSTVRLTTAQSIPANANLVVNYVSLSGDQDWLTNQTGIGILSFQGFSVDTDTSPQPVQVVTAFAGSDYNGTSWPLVQGLYDFSAVSSSPIGNDAISSLQIADGYSVIACEHGDGSGRCETYTTSVPALGTMNNRISNIEVVETSNPGVPVEIVTAFADNNFGGPTWSLTEGDYAIADIHSSPIGNDAISSIQIAEGYAVIACEHSNKNGRCETYTSSVPVLGIMNNTISSLTVTAVSDLAGHLSY